MRRIDRFHMLGVVRVCCWSVYACFLWRPSIAQETASGFIGVVRDESGALLPGVTITVTSPSLQVP